MSHLILPECFPFSRGHCMGDDFVLHRPTDAIFTSPDRFHDPPLEARAFVQAILLESLSDFFCNFSHAEGSRADRMNWLAGLAGPSCSTWIIPWKVKKLILWEIKYQRVPDLGCGYIPPDQYVDLARGSGLSCMEHIRGWKSWRFLVEFIQRLELVFPGQEKSSPSQIRS